MGTPTRIPARSATAVEAWRGPVDVLSLVAAPGRTCPQALTVRGWRVAVADPVAVVTHPAGLDALGRSCGWRAAPEPGAPPFVGGAVGCMTDGCAEQFVDLPWRRDQRAAAAPLPPLWFGVYDSAVCVPPGGEGAWLVAADLPASRRPVADRLADLRGWVAGHGRPPGARRSPPACGARTTRPAVRTSLDEEGHAAGVARVLEWIAAGDLYQLNLTLQVAVPWRRGGLSLARALETATPGSAHAAYQRLPGGVEVVSVSPETFLRTDGARAVTRPIKGTRPRGDGHAADASAARALVASAKDGAEHTMIVDLERNDLGRVCVPGTVRVPDLARLERHPTVWHLTSTVEGRLREDVTLGGLLRATFPSGSVTGAPKRMAVARTRLVEPVRRGVYCGAIGVVTRGLVDLSVAIRTAVVHGRVASYGTGGGIVADSDPGEEWAEAMAKAAAFLAATGARAPDATRR